MLNMDANCINFILFNFCLTVKDGSTENNIKVLLIRCSRTVKSSSIVHVITSLSTRTSSAPCKLNDEAPPEVFYLDFVNKHHKSNSFAFIKPLNGLILDI